MSDPLTLGSHVVNWRNTEFTVSVEHNLRDTITVRVEPDCLTLHVHVPCRTSELIQVMYEHHDPTMCPGYRKKGYMRFLMGFVDYINGRFGVRSCELQDKSTFVEDGTETSPFLFVQRGWPLYVGYGYMYNSGNRDENVKNTNVILARVWCDLQSVLTRDVIQEFEELSERRRIAAASDLTFPKFRAVFVARLGECEIKFRPKLTYGLARTVHGGLYFKGSHEEVIKRGRDGEYVFLMDETGPITDVRGLREGCAYFCGHPSPMQEASNMERYWKMTRRPCVQSALGMTLRDFMSRSNVGHPLHQFLIEKCGLRDLSFEFVKYYEKDGRDSHRLRSFGQVGPPVLTSVYYE